MRGSNDRATPATFTKSPAGRGAAGCTRDLRAEMLNMRTMTEKIVEVHVAVSAVYFFRIKEIADSIGSVRCCTSARTAKRI